MNKINICGLFVEFTVNLTCLNLLIRNIYRLWETVYTIFLCIISFNLAKRLILLKFWHYKCCGFWDLILYYKLTSFILKIENKLKYARQSCLHLQNMLLLLIYIYIQHKHIMAIIYDLILNFCLTNIIWLTIVYLFFWKEIIIWN